MLKILAKSRSVLYFCFNENCQMMEQLQRENQELRALLDEAMDIAAFTILNHGIFIKQRFSRLRQAVKTLKQTEQAGKAAESEESV